jgi:hypothetical protein
MTIGPYGSTGRVVDYTDELNIIPNQWGRINELGLFNSEPVASRVVIIDKVANELTVLPERPVGAPATVADNEETSSLLLEVPHIPHNDYLLPSDVQDRRRPGDTGPDTTERKRATKLEYIRRKHALTLEFLRMGAIKGLIVGGTGNTIYNLYTEFGYTQFSVNCQLGTASTNVKGKIFDALRHIDDNTFNGGTSAGYYCLCSASFFDALISHPTVAAAYQYYSSSQDYLRNDIRRNFNYNGVIFEEYRATVNIGGVATKFIADDEAYIYPLGVSDMFVNYYAPANHFDYVNTPGLPIYVWEHRPTTGRRIEFESESNPLPICRRPQAVVLLTVA